MGTYRWPSARPDDVVPEQSFLNLVPHESEAKKVKSFATTLDSMPRRSWTSPMRITPDSTFSTVSAQPM